MDKRDRDDLDRHIEASDDIEGLTADSPEVTQYDDVELSELDKRDIDMLGEERIIKRTFDAYVHDEPPNVDQRETWVQGTSAFVDEFGNEHVVELRLDHGAGMGNSKLSFAVDVDGKRFAREYIDITTLTHEWLAAVAGDWISEQLVPKTGDEG